VPNTWASNSLQPLVTKCCSVKVGVALYVPVGSRWMKVWVDDDGMACEDLTLADLDGDGRLDIVASGRSTHNLKVYFNESSR